MSASSSDGNCIYRARNSLRTGSVLRGGIIVMSGVRPGPNGEPDVSGSAGRSVGRSSLPIDPGCKRGTLSAGAAPIGTALWAFICFVASPYG